MEVHAMMQHEMRLQTASHPVRSHSPSTEFAFPLLFVATVFGFIAGAAIAGIVVPAIVQIVVPAAVRAISGA
jgi:hypothetical protein